MLTAFSRFYYLNKKSQSLLWYIASEVPKYVNELELRNAKKALQVVQKNTKEGIFFLPFLWQELCVSSRKEG